MRERACIGNDLLPLTPLYTDSIYVAMRYTLVFETDTLPFFIGEFKTLDEAYGAAQGLVEYFRNKGYPTLNQFRIRQKT